MLNVLRKRRSRYAQGSGERVSFGSISKGDLVKLKGGFAELSRHVPRFMAEREKGLNVLKTVDQYRRIQHSLAVFESRWGRDELGAMADTADVEIEFTREAASGFALALVELVLVCRAVSTDERLIIADIATSLLTEYRNRVMADSRRVHTVCHSELS